MPPPECEWEEGRVEKILKACRQRYGRPRAVVEERILKWAMNREKKENHNILLQSDKYGVSAQQCGIVLLMMCIK